jgi:hypothetical protein
MFLLEPFIFWIEAGNLLWCNRVMSSVLPCCVANTAKPNPNTSNYDTSTVVQQKSGAKLVSAVSEFYSAASTRQLRPNAPPIFKTYQQMMEWKQSQNRR